MTPQRRPTLAEQAYEELQSQIMLGSLPPGLRLLPEDIASRLAISPTPVKEALALLERDGLINGKARRVSTVRRFERDDIIEIFDARTVMEVTAVSRGIGGGKVTEAFLDRLRALFNAHLAEVRRQDETALGTAIALDCKFHELLLELTGNRLMRDWHQQVMRQTQTARNYTVKLYNMQRLEAEHGAIVDALSSGDAHKAAEAVSRHLSESRDELLRRPPEEYPVRQ